MHKIIKIHGSCLLRENLTRTIGELYPDIPICFANGNNDTETIISLGLVRRDMTFENLSMCMHNPYYVAQKHFVHTYCDILKMRLQDLLTPHRYLTTPSYHAIDALLFVLQEYLHILQENCLLPEMHILTTLHQANAPIGCVVASKQHDIRDPNNLALIRMRAFFSSSRISVAEVTPGDFHITDILQFAHALLHFEASKAFTPSFSLPKRATFLENPNIIFCPLTKSLMQQPVLAADGYTYERSAIEAYFAKGYRLSPITHIEFAHLTLVDDIAVLRLVEQHIHTQPKHPTPQNKHLVYL